MRAFLASTLAVAALLCTDPARSAKIVTIDFEDQAQEAVVVANLTIRGFRFSPNCHYDLLGPSSGSENPHPSQWIGFDCVGAESEPNPNFLGPDDAPFASLWLDYSERPFTLLGLDPIAERGDWFVTSSNGGSFINIGNNDHVDFSGAQWTNILWLLFSAPDHGGAPQGFDNIAFRVPEPGTALLVAGGLAFLAYTRRKRLLR